MKQLVLRVGNRLEFRWEDGERNFTQEEWNDLIGWLELGFEYTSDSAKKGEYLIRLMELQRDYQQWQKRQS